MFSLYFLSAMIAAPDDGWIDLTSTRQVRAAQWRTFAGEWLYSNDAKLDPQDNKKLTGVPNPDGSVVITNRGKKIRDLYTKKNYTDLAAHVEFLIARGSNAGVKMMGRYEIQIYDSFGKTKLNGSECGGIYPRAEVRPKYGYLDDGGVPRVNACKPAGEWQTFDIVFRGPRFDADGRKKENARFLKVVFNGQLIHENAEVFYPTGSAWRLVKEVPAGPFQLQCDHGPVAYRNVRIKPLGK